MFTLAAMRGRKSSKKNSIHAVQFLSLWQVKGDLCTTTKLYPHSALPGLSLKRKWKWRWIRCKWILEGNKPVVFLYQPMDFLEIWKIAFCPSSASYISCLFITTINKEQEFISRSPWQSCSCFTSLLQSPTTDLNFERIKNVQKTRSYWGQNHLC